MITGHWSTTGLSDLEVRHSRRAEKPKRPISTKEVTQEPVNAAEELLNKYMVEYCLPCLCSVLCLLCLLLFCLYVFLLLKQSCEQMEKPIFNFWPFLVSCCCGPPQVLREEESQQVMTSSSSSSSSRFLLKKEKPAPRPPTPRVEEPPEVRRRCCV